jgi:hypothetical protein
MQAVPIAAEQTSLGFRTKKVQGCGAVRLAAGAADTPAKTLEAEMLPEEIFYPASPFRSLVNGRLDAETRRHSRGDNPVARRKAMANWLGPVKPTRNAISVMPRSGSVRRRRAAASRCSKI